MAFNEYAFALQFRDVIQRMVTDQIDQVRPRIQYAVVTTIDRANNKCTITYPGDVSAVPMNMSTIAPTITGQVVRIEGVVGDRHITEVLGPVLAGFTPWVAVAFVNSWTNYDTGAVYNLAGYKRTSDGMVQFHGLIKNSTATAKTVMFNLPVGYRPDKTNLFIALANDGLCRIAVSPDGTVTLQNYGAAPASAGYVSLDGIRFMAIN